MSKPALIAELERLLQVNLHPIPVAGFDPPLDALRARRDPKLGGWQAQYYLAPDGFLAGLNLMYTGLTDAQWAQVAARIDLSRLEALNLRGNELTQVAGLDKMTALRYVDLCENKLKEFLPPPAARLEHVLLTGNPDLNVPPPEVVAQGRWAILGYFEELRRSGEEKSLEAKVILIGEGQAGKTSLRTRLLHPGDPLPHTADRTKGLDIEIEKYNYDILGGETMRLNVFDFGGQDHYKPLHQFFYSRNTLYVLVSRNGDESNDFDFWLDTAQLFGQGSPVLLVHNLFGDVQSAFNRAKYARFEAILKDSLSVNLLSLAGWPEVKKRIEQLAESLPHVHERIPKSWANIRRELLARREENILPLSAFLNICARPENGGMDRERALRCSAYLHDIGICLHYQDNELLRRQVIVKNEWATEAVYRVIDDEQIGRQNGRFSEEDLQRIWHQDEYAELRPELLELMKRFRLCYPLPGDAGAHIAPQRLPLTPPEGYAWGQDRDLQLYVEYDFMPPGLLSQLIVLCHAHIAGGRTQVWRDGMVLQLGADTLAEATLSKRGGKQTIGIRANGPQRRELLTYIDTQLESLHKPFGEGLKLERKIPCVCERCKNAEQPYFHDLSKLERRQKAGVRTSPCEESYKEVPIEDLLGNIFSQKTIDSESMDPAKVFISYSSKDKPYREKLENHLVMLRRGGYIDVWSDRLLEAGDDWDADIKKSLHEATLYLFLVSDHLLNSEYIWDVEIQKALDRVDTGLAKAVPIILSPCDWNLKKKGSEEYVFPFARYQGLPEKGKPVASFANQDEAYAAIARALREIVS